MGLGHRMTVTTVRITKAGFRNNIKLKELGGKGDTTLFKLSNEEKGNRVEVKELYGSQFYNRITNETLRLDKDRQSLICVEKSTGYIEEPKYFIVPKEAIVHSINSIDERVGRSYHEWNPCSPEKWKELHETKEDFTKAVDDITDKSSALEQ